MVVHASAVFLGLIVFFVIGLIHDILEISVVKIKEGLSMRIKITIILATGLKSILYSVWTVGANFMAGALLA